MLLLARPCSHKGCVDVQVAGCVGFLVGALAKVDGGVKDVDREVGRIV